MEARAEKRIINVKKGPKDIPHKSAFPAAKSSRRPVDFSESEKEESEYETETEGEEDGDSPVHRRGEEAEQDYTEEEEEHEQGEEEETYAESEEKAEEAKQVNGSGGSLKRKDIESDKDSPPRKAATHRRMKMVYDSDEK